MDPLLFSQDLELGPSRFRELLQVLEHDDPWAQAIGATPRRIVLLGMGSSHFANCVLALRLQAAGIVAHAVLASADPLPLVDAAIPLPLPGVKPCPRRADPPRPWRRRGTMPVAAASSQ